ncbi:MAG: N-acetylneuraminate synthase [Gammaproteobacteria bacterium RIFCSPHIGHO2_12_FULL_38_11]|nr:MAG: N-acetylneuraminate synthase [Gammaproteobacteria bacterium RIFCSPHIGHO2_12_FULL_38_11]
MKNQTTLIIAEAGVNHNGDIKLGLQLIDAAKEAGADAVKFQTFSADALVSKNAPKAAYQKQNTSNAESQYEMLKKLELTEEAHHILKLHCDAVGIQFLSTPFDGVSADFLLKQLKLKTIKIASGEIATAPLLLQIARANPEVILSTGMASLGEIEQALAVLAFGYLNLNEKPSVAAFMQAYYSEAGQEKLKEKVSLLHCTSDYPADFNSVNLRAMDTLKSAFGLSVGYSDHTQGIAIPVAAVARGACIIEKHFTLDRSMPGPDHKASLEPIELKNMVTAIREVEVALGRSLKIPTQKELDTKAVARKSLVAVKTIKSGEGFTAENIALQRPGNGISPMLYWEYLNRVACRDYQVGELIEA